MHLAYISVMCCQKRSSDEGYSGQTASWMDYSGCKCHQDDREDISDLATQVWLEAFCLYDVTFSLADSLHPFSCST